MKITKKSLLSFLLLGSLTFLTVAVNYSFAQFNPEIVRQQAAVPSNMSQEADIAFILINFSTWAMYLIAFVAVVAFVVSGFMFIFSAGETGAEKARKILMFAIVGLVVALLGWVILNTVSNMVFGYGSYGGYGSGGSGGSFSVGGRSGGFNWGFGGRF